MMDQVLQLALQLIIYVFDRNSTSTHRSKDRMRLALIIFRLSVECSAVGSNVTL
ncbi:hypothetical protein CIPAW_13G178100 [Carya illinoinensis]|uniref:Uncharacterized protein n=1 Tax=Carya illinoinensis TaxID=32201 RepID=A0A8T1NUX0_CARIL|nr:hypothetical protein CIPAW_13G178100 [Carya illinoinensis]